MPRHEPRLMTVPDAASYLGLSEAALRTLMYRRGIPFVKNGRSVRLDRKTLDQWIDDHTVEVAS